MLGYWDRYLLAHRYAPEDGGEGEGEDGGNGGSGGAGTGGSNTQQQKPAWADEFGDSFDPDKAWQTISSLRTAEKQLKKERGELAGKVKKFEDDGKTETERLTAELEELRTKVSTFEARERRIGLQSQVVEEARRAGAIYPDDLFRLLDESDLKLDDNGKITNLPKLVADLKQARPALFSNRNIGQHDGDRTPPASNDMNQLLRRAVGR